ncbi:MAG: ornithine carbamoyltransferase [Acidobacteriota bacterium]|nr:ornithine carbamoyltransferase [Acidobacteriota bacterium]
MLLTQIESRERLSVRSLINVGDLTRGDIDQIFALAARVKQSPRDYARALEGKQLAMIFEKPSLRTRVTFETGMTSMGGYAVYLDHAKPRLGERESIKDVARNLDRWVNGIVARTFAHDAVVELAENCSIPVINGLTDLAHPCQALADFFTLEEKLGRLEPVRLAYVGDGNNVCNSLMMTAAKLGASLRVATPPGFEPKPGVLVDARASAEQTGGRIELFHDPFEAVSGCHAVYTDVWAGMGQEYAAHLREQVFAPFQVTEKLISGAAPGAFFMHCLPAHRGKEVTDEVMDSPCSIVYDQAENRLHVQKAILLLLMQN